MHRLRTSTMLALGAVIAPPLFDHVLPSGPTFLVAPLVPGLYLAGLLDRIGLLAAMDSHGDLTGEATVVMYLASFLLWLTVAFTVASVHGRQTRARVG